MNNLGCNMFVTKRNGKTEPVKFDKITERIARLIHPNEKHILDASKVAQETIKKVYSGIDTETLDLESAKVCANMNTTHSLYNYLAGRINISNLHKKTLKSFVEKQNIIQEITKKNSTNNIGILDEKYLKYVNDNAKKLENIINYKRDFNLDFFGFKTLERAYLLKDPKTKKIIERPQDMFLRVATFINMGNLKKIKATYNMMSLGFYTHATPTLFNSGTRKANLSSCFLIGTKDSMDGITNTWKQVSLISKWSGGIGLHVSNIRAKGSLIRGTNGESSGIIPMLQVYNNIARYVNQCFIGSTKIYTEKGILPIESLKVGDKVFTKDGTLKHIKQIFQDKYTGKALNIKAKHNFDWNITVTPEHPFLVIKDQKKMTNYTVLENRIKRNLVNKEWIEAKDITEHDLITIPIPKYEQDFRLYHSTDCYFYGVMLGDGHICKERNEAGVTLGHKKEKVIEFVKNYLDLQLIKYWINETESVVNIRWSVSSKFKFTRNQLYDDNQIKKCDDVMLNLPLDKAKSIIKGLMETDGCIGNELTIELTSLQVLESMKYILLRMGILSSGYSRNRVGDVSSYKNITTRLPTWVLRIPKVESIAELLNIEPGKYKKFFSCGDFLYTRFNSIEETEIDTVVYDLEINSNHNYLTEIGLVHNGGKRKGSFAIYLEPHHPDIFDFLDLRKNFGAETERARDLFLALWVSDLFMKQVDSGGDWYLMCPDECPGLTDVWGKDYEDLYWKYVRENKYRKKIKARELMRAIIDAQIETGTPYITYKDAANSKSNQQNLGTIKSSNLCNEIIEYSDDKETAVCNLASIAISKCVVPFNSERIWTIYVKDNCKYCRWAKSYLKYHKYEFIIKEENIREVFNVPDNEKITYPQILYGNQRIGGFTELIWFTKSTFNFDKLYQVAYLATENLNNVIDVNYYPTSQSKLSNMKHRPIGLGIQGLADTLAMLRIPFESEQSIKFNQDMMETIYFAAMTASKDIAKKRNKMSHFIKIKDKLPTFYDPNLTLESDKINNLYHELKPNQYELKNTEYLGAYSSFKGSPLSEGKFQFDLWNVKPSKWDWDNLRKEVLTWGVRNSLLTALMPTASTSQILGNNECFEYFTNNIYTRRTLAGDFVVVNKHMINDLTAIGEWSYDCKQHILACDGSVKELNIPNLFKHLYKTIWEIKQVWSLKNALARAPYVDQTQSMNIFMGVPNSQKLYSAHMWGWKHGLKTGMYYLRTKPATTATKFTVDPNLVKTALPLPVEDLSNTCEACSS